MLTILDEDAHWLVVCKPAGLPTQSPKAGVQTLEDLVRAHLSPNDPAAAYLGTVHRLDRPVSGAIVFAKTPKSARRLATHFEQRRVVKEYWAIVSGSVEPGSGTWEDWLIADQSSGLRRARRVAVATPGARMARTRYDRLNTARVPDCASALRLWPETGRMHQLRAQSSGRGWPILGDSMYGSSIKFGAAIALHARRLDLIHPTLGTQRAFIAPLPAAWRENGVEIDENQNLTF
jgi:23S rRNA pseudouridine1911/1915/1917 synthase